MLAVKPVPRSPCGLANTLTDRITLTHHLTITNKERGGGGNTPFRIMAEDFYQLGLSCQRWRESMGIKAKTVAEQTGYCKANISKFEYGQSYNAKILLWYLRHGFPIQEYYFDRIRG